MIDFNRKQEQDDADLMFEKKGVINFLGMQDCFHDRFHVERVVGFAKDILFSSSGSEVNESLVLKGAVLHQFHDPNLHYLRNFLNSLDIISEEYFDLYHIVEACRPNNLSNASREAKIVFDADALDLMGPQGIFREVLCNRYIRNQDNEQAVFNAFNTYDLFLSKMQTKVGIEIANDINSTVNLLRERPAPSLTNPINAIIQLIKNHNLEDNEIYMELSDQAKESSLKESILAILEASTFSSELSQDEYLYRVSEPAELFMHVSNSFKLKWQM